MSKNKLHTYCVWGTSNPYGSRVVTIDFAFWHTLQHFWRVDLAFWHTLQHFWRVDLAFLHWGDFGVTLGNFRGLWEAFGGFGEALGRLWGDFGRLWEAFGGFGEASGRLCEAL